MEKSLADEIKKEIRNQIEKLNRRLSDPKHGDEAVSYIKGSLGALEMLENHIRRVEEDGYK